MNDKITLLELSRKPPVQTDSTGSSADALPTKTNIKNTKQNKTTSSAKETPNKVSSPSRKEKKKQIKQKRSTEGCSKFKSPETRQVEERLVSTLLKHNCYYKQI